VARAAASSIGLIGPKSHYLALGDSLAFGYQPDLDYYHGYTDVFYQNLKTYGTSSYTDKGCPGETSYTFIHGGCPGWILRKNYYVGSQLNSALSYLHAYVGQVSPVTLDLGANDLLPDLNPATCTASASFSADLQTLDTNLRQIILPQLKAALTSNGQTTGDLIVMNYYNAYENVCPNTFSYIQTLNQHLASDVHGFGIIADVFDQFGGAQAPNPNLCSYTWICSVFHDIHAKDAGYQAIAQAFEHVTGY
jgi:lysophospholipase L1-like esterase